MKHILLKKLLIFCAVFGCNLAVSFPAMAASPTGNLEGVDDSSIYGWVWDSDNYNHIIPVEISIYPAQSTEALKTDTIKADDYQEKLQQNIGDGYHGFKYSVDWNQYQQTILRITAYAVTETERVFLGELTYNNAAEDIPSPESAPNQEDFPAEVLGQDFPSITETAPEEGPGSISVSFQEPGSSPTFYQEASVPGGQGPDNSQPYLQRLDLNTSSQAEKKTILSDTPSASAKKTTSAPWEKGPGVAPDITPAPIKEESPQKISLGIFTTTGYCSCEVCSTGNNLTYTETMPQAGHTIAADITIFPIGTKLMIGETIYTVEDIGSSVTRNKIDIFYATHQEAAEHGVKQEEVFAVYE